MKLRQHNVVFATCKLTTIHTDRHGDYTTWHCYHLILADRLIVRYAIVRYVILCGLSQNALHTAVQITHKNVVGNEFYEF